MHTTRSRNRILMVQPLPIIATMTAYFERFGFKLELLPELRLEEILASQESLAALVIHLIALKEAHTTLRMLYNRFPVPLIILSDIRDEMACVTLLEQGADDFIVTPVNPRELHARINAITRRIPHGAPPTEQEDVESGKEVLLCDDLQIYPASRQVFVKNQEIFLSTGEYALLLAFVRQPQCILSRHFLSQAMKSTDFQPLDRRVDVQISRLRHKLEPTTNASTLIKTVRNVGYLFTARIITTILSSRNDV